MKNIALWGYGKQGKWLYENIKQEWCREYRITAVFDRKLAGTRTSDGREILSPESLGDHYNEGLFEEVLIALAYYWDRKENQEMRRKLQELSIPLCVPDNRRSFVPMDQFPSVERSLDLPFPKYHAAVLRGLSCFRPYLDERCFLYDADGRILGDFWYDHELRQEPMIYAFRPSRPKQTERMLAGDWCLLSRCYGSNYWHFIFQAMDQAWILEKMGFQGKYIVPAAPFVAPLMALIGVDGSRLLSVNELRFDACRLERVFCVAQDSRCQNPSTAARVLAEMAQSVTSRPEIREADGVYPDRLFVRRSKSRRLLKAEPLLERYGFSTIDPDELSVEEQIRFFHAAKIVLSPHGANSANSLFMRPGSVLIETFPNNCIQPACIETAAAVGVRYLEAVESRIQMRFVPGNKDPLDFYRDYDIACALLEHTIRNAIDLAEKGSRS